MSEIRLFIDGIEARIKKGISILEAAHSADIYIPTLCYHPDLPSDGSCGLCLVEVEGKDELSLACTTEATDGMVIRTYTDNLKFRQREVLKQILTKHPCGCLTCWRRERCKPFDVCLRNVAITHRCVLCARNGNCELQKVVDFVGVVEEEFTYSYRNMPVYQDNPFFDRDYNLCIACGRCVRACKDLRGIEAIELADYDEQRIPKPTKGETIIDAGCKLCCVCVEVCPTGALMDRDAKWQPDYQSENATNPCSFNCPAGIDVPLYVSLIADGKYDEALGVIREKVPFPASLGRVCIHPCEQACKRNKLNDPIAIKSLKQFVADRDAGEWKKYSRRLPSTGKKVAVVGSGPAGLTTAYYLGKAGHSVTVFEEFSKAGGMMRVGIPRYRLPAKVLDAEIAEIESVGVEIKYNTRIESLEPLFEQGYSAIFLGLGAHKGTSARVEGEDTPGVIDGVTVLRKVSLDEKIDLGKKVAVIGGGNVAIDCARTALRLGADEVTIVYRRTRAEMPASPEEVDAAIHEKINILFLAAPLKVSKKDNDLILTCNRMELGEPDASGRRRPVPIVGSEFDTEFDSIVAAIGQVSDIPEAFGVETERWNTIRTNPDTLATSREGVYAGGDVVIGPDSVIRAIAQGRIAASSIDRYLGGSGEIDEVLAPNRVYNPCVGKAEDFIEQTRATLPELEVNKRISNFDEVELVLPEDAAVNEAKRCLQCAVRTLLKPVPLPPVKDKSRVEEAKASV